MKMSVLNRANFELNGEILEVRNITRKAIIIVLIQFHLTLFCMLKPVQLEVKGI